MPDFERHKVFQTKLSGLKADHAIFRRVSEASLRLLTKKILWHFPRATKAFKMRSICNLKLFFR